MDRPIDSLSERRLAGPSIALIAAALVLCGCAQSSAGSMVAQEEQVHTKHSLEDVASDGRADPGAIVDSIADKLAAEQPVKAANPQGKPLEGPDITPQQLEERLLMLADTLRGPDQVKVEFVERTLRMPLADPETGEVVGAQGSAGQGTYSIHVAEPHDGGPMGGLGIRLDAGSLGSCGLAYLPVARALESSGYKASPLPRFQKPRVAFLRFTGNFAVIVTLSLDSHDSPQCIHYVNYVVQDAKDV